jgi:hypothetical protein
LSGRSLVNTWSRSHEQNKKFSKYIRFLELMCVKTLVSREKGKFTKKFPLNRSQHRMTVSGVTSIILVAV